MQTASVLAGGPVFARLLSSSSSSWGRSTLRPRPGPLFLSLTGNTWNSAPVRATTPPGYERTLMYCHSVWRDDLSLHCERHSRMYMYGKAEFSGRASSGVQRLRCSEHGEEPLGEEGWEGLERWKRGGGVVHRLAQVDASVIVEPGAVVHANAVIGADTRICSGCVVGPHVSIGSHNKIGYNVALQNCSVGNACVLHSGVCIGQDGFGFTVDNSGEMVKKPQMLSVRIGNNVEIGANSCIDRGSWRDTTIGDHTKIDNLVQIGHNVVIGRCCMLCGQVGLAGSCTLGDYVVMGGKSGVADHVSIASKVRIAAKGGVISDILEPGDYGGFPAVPAREWRRSVVNIRKLGKEPQVVTCDPGEV